MQGASVQEAAAGPGDVGEGENLCMNPAIYPIQTTERKIQISTSVVISSSQAVSHCSAS